MRRSGDDGDSGVIGDNEVIETIEYFEDGSIHREDLPDGTDREFHESGALASEGKRVDHDEMRPMHGLWRFGDEDGVIRRESDFRYGDEIRRSLLRSDAEIAANNALAVRCSGPVSVAMRGDGAKYGAWSFSDVEDDVLREVDLGPSTDEESLLSHPASQEGVSPEQLGKVALGAGAEARLARLRIFGRGQEMDMSATIHAGPAWQSVDQSGEFKTNSGIIEALNSMLFGYLPPQTLETLAHSFFSRSRPQVALDLADASLRFDPTQNLKARVDYLRALGRDEDADAIADLSPTRVSKEQERALLAIRASPTEDEPCLAYARLVESVTPEHAALIVAACADDDSATDEMAKALENTLPDSAYWHGDMKRGFFETTSLSLEARDFLSYADWLFRAAPHVVQLTLDDADAVMANLVEMSALSRYEELSFIETLLFDGKAAQLARCKHIGGLRHLGLANTSMGDEDLLEITGSHAFPRLSSLNISNSREGQDYGSASFATLKEACFASTLEVLAFDRRYFEASVVVEVLAALPQLHSVDMEGTSLDSEGLIALAELQREWTHLGMDSCRIGDAGAVMFASCVSNSLRFLDLGSNPLGDDGISAVLLSEALCNLETLNIQSGTAYDPQVDSRFGTHMKQAPMASSLKTLSLSLGELGATGCVAFAQAPLRSLVRLDLYGNGVGDAGAIALARAPALGVLHYLNLGNNNITNEGALELARSTTLKSLAWLELGGAELSEDVYQQLCQRYKTVHKEYPWGR